jgi:FkbM family methyltransferase
MLNQLKTLAYDTADFLTFGRGIRRNFSGTEVRFPARWSRYYPSDYEKETFAWLEHCCSQGDVALDIGGHLGLFAVALAKKVGQNGRIYTFEPTLRLQAVIEQVLELNGCQSVVKLVKKAVSERSGECDFFDTGDAASNANSLVKTERGQVNTRVYTVSVDDFVVTEGCRVKLIKIDAEGAEAGILRGAKETLSAYRPFVHLAIHPDHLFQSGESLQSLWNAIESAGYVVTFRGRRESVAEFLAQKYMRDVELLPSEISTLPLESIANQAGVQDE